MAWSSLEYLPCFEVVFLYQLFTRLHTARFVPTSSTYGPRFLETDRTVEKCY